MADAIPVNSRTKAVKVDPVVTVHNPSEDPKEHAAAKAKLLARAQSIVEAEVPFVPDDLVGSIGQSSSYGRFQSVTEVPYDVVDRKGEPTGAVRTYIRIDH